MPIIRYIFLILLIFAPASALASSAHEFSAEYTGDFQTNFKKERIDENGDKIPSVNYSNWLKLFYGYNFNKNISVQVGTLLSAQVNKCSNLLGEYQNISSIADADFIFVLNRAGIQWQMSEGKHKLFFGINCINRDYFTSDVISHFTNSSHGFFPPMDTNYLAPNEPRSAFGIHYGFSTSSFTFNATVANGIAYKKFNGRENFFRICPKDDGVLAMAQLAYTHKESEYVVGAITRFGGIQIPSNKYKTNAAIWAYTDQKITESLRLSCGYSFAFPRPIECKHFAFLGGKFDYKRCEFGLMTSFAWFSFGKESSTEINCKTTINKYLYIQPALHFVKNDDSKGLGALVRIGVTI